MTDQAGAETRLSIASAAISDLPMCHAIDAATGNSTSQAIFERALQHGYLLVAKDGAETIGYLRYGYVWDAELPYIEMLRVQPGRQRIGAGRLLVTQLAQRLRRAGMIWLLSSTEASNHNSIEFHRHLGFKECGKLDINQDGTPEVFFKKWLAEQTGAAGHGSSWPTVILPTSGGPNR